MKIDRLAKVLLVIIVLLLTANYFTRLSSPLTTVAYADPAPAFIQVGKVYCRDTVFSACTTGGGTPFNVLKIGTGGWIYVENVSRISARQYWLNTNQASEIVEKP